MALPTGFEPRVQRNVLIAAAEPAAGDFLRGMELTAARPIELSVARNIRARARATGDRAPRRGLASVSALSALGRAGLAEPDRRQEKVRRPGAHGRSHCRRWDAVRVSFNGLLVSRCPNIGVATCFGFIVPHGHSPLTRGEVAPFVWICRYASALGALAAMRTLVGSAARNGSGDPAAALCRNLQPQLKLTPASGYGV
jgi:hypothetical protein